MNKKWEVKISDDELTNKIANEFNISKLVARILANKGLKESNEIEVFLNPSRSDFHDPFLMPDMKIAVDRIIKAIETKEKVAIYGDYDVDGITSSTVLKRFLSERGLDADIYIPNRLNEGYGLNEKAIKEIAQTNHTLIITVDCGITGNKEIELAKTLKIDTVVTDHHEPTEELPKALAVVDCKRKDNKYPFSELAGVEEANQPAHAFLRTYLIEESADILLEDDDEGDNSHAHQFIQDRTQQAHFQYLTHKEPDKYEEHDAHEDVQ